jgi:hypothetical protein
MQIGQIVFEDYDIICAYLFSQEPLLDAVFTEGVATYGNFAANYVVNAD